MFVSLTEDQSLIKANFGAVCGFESQRQERQIPSKKSLSCANIDPVSAMFLTHFAQMLIHPHS